LGALCIHYIPYAAKLSRGKTFAVVHKIHSLENFHGESGHDHHVLYTASDSRRKLSRLAEKPQKFPSLESFVMYGIWVHVSLYYWLYGGKVWRVQALIWRIHYKKTFGKINIFTKKYFG